MNPRAAGDAPAALYHYSGAPMRRLFPLLVFALVPVVTAAPVPPAPPPEFGAVGTLTRAELKRIVFDSRLDAEVRKPRRRKDAEEKILRDEEFGEPATPRPVNHFDVAVHMPVTRFREGEPAPAYFVLRNNRGAPFRLQSRIDVCTPTPLLRGEYCDITVRDRATGKPVASRLSAATNCGGGALVVVPADGFYCVSADLNWLTGGVLPPGQYEVSWRYDELRSAPVLFSVLKRHGVPVPALAKRPELRFFHLTEDLRDGERAPRSQSPDTALVWHDSELNPVETDDLAAALAVGQPRVYAPDLRTIPTTDKFVDARAEWLTYRDGDRVRVTLRAAPPHREAFFGDVPQLYLVLEVPNGDPGPGRLREVKKFAVLDRTRLLTTPFTVEAKLPDGWRDFSAPPGAIRVAVLVAADEVELPLYGDIQQKEQLKEAHSEEPSPRPVWRGFVRTEFTELRFQLPYRLAP